MFGEKAVRRNEAPISSATERVALLKTASSIGSNEFIASLFAALPLDSLYLYDQVRARIYDGVAIRRHNCSRAVLVHNCRAGKRIPRQQQVAIEHRSFEPLIREHHFLLL